LLFNITHLDDLLWGLGGNLLGPDGKASLTSSAAKKAMSIYSTIYKNEWTSPDSAQAEFSETNSALEAGNAAFAPIIEDVGKYGYSPPLFSGTFDAMTQMIKALNPGWVGITPIDDALADANQKLQAQLDKMK
jgi:hypothetical protein